MKDYSLLEGNDIFKNSYFKEHEKKLVGLAKNGQHPKALYIGCADSRVVPDLIMDTSPGDLFVLRNVGNFVAPYKPDEEFHSTASGIEYAVEVLEVSEIIICGHTHCGAIASLYANLDKTAMVHTIKWLSLGAKAKSLASLALPNEEDKEELLRLTEKLSIVTQIEHLLTYPCVKERVDSGKISIHGWLYNIEDGSIQYYDPDETLFKTLQA
jgi:carbonic anhydrase